MTEDANDSNEQPKDLSSVIGRRLAVDEEGAIVSWKDLGLEGVQKSAMALQSWRNHHEWFEMIAVTELGPIRSDWTREVFGLFGIAGE